MHKQRPYEPQRSLLPREQGCRRGLIAPPGAISDPLMFPKSRVGPNATDGVWHVAILQDQARVDHWLCLVQGCDDLWCVRRLAAIQKD